jgi:hypothetical protein
MSTDAQGQEPDREPVDIWTLPGIIDVRAVLVRFKKPLIRYDGQRRVEHKEAVELMVKTAGPIPERALSPVLMVGDVALDDYEAAGQNLYRFYAFEVKQMHDGAPMHLEWPTRRPRREPKSPVFRLRGEEER